MDYNIAFPEQIISNANTGGMIMISAIFILGFIIFMRYSAKIMPAFMGLLLHLLFVVAGVEVVTSVIAMMPVINELVLDNVVVFCVVRVIIVALLIHCARWIMVAFANRNGDVSLGSAMIGGLGMGASQAIVDGLNLISVSTLGTMVNSPEWGNVIADMTTEDVTELLEMLNNTIEVPPIYFMLKAINNTMDMFYFIGAALIVYAIIKHGLPKFWYAIAIGVNVLMQAASMAGDYQIYDNYVVLSAMKLTVLVIMAICVFRIDSTYLGDELKSFSKLRNSGSMPKYGKLKNK